MTAHRRHAPAPPEPALLALEAFEPGAALVDLANQRIAWSSPGFEAHACLQADDPLDRAEARLPGLLQALARLAPPAAFTQHSDADDSAPRLRWRVAADGGALCVEAALVRPGLAALRLRCEAALADEAADADAREQAARRHLEDRERMLFTSRALAVGEMASTLAHELNQPIGTVTNVLRGLRARLERDASAELAAGAQLALEQALFAARIIARIREYTQSRQPRRDRLDLGAVVRTAVGLLDWEIRRDGVALALAQAPEPCPVQGDEVMLQQVFVNLLRNALEAMRDNPPDALGGAARRLALALAVERGMAVLTVRDNGCGLPKDGDDRLFVPFQSTKPNGMGIGLNICRSFVELHQGRLWFTPNDQGPDARPDERGCTFHVALPLVPASGEDTP